MSAIINALVGELVEVGRLMKNLSTDARPFDIQFEDDGEQYVLIVRKLNVMPNSDKGDDSEDSE